YSAGHPPRKIGHVVRASREYAGRARNNAGHPTLDLHAYRLDLRGRATELKARRAVLERGQVDFHGRPLRVDAGIHLLPHAPQVCGRAHQRGARRRAAHEAGRPERLLGAADRPAGRVHGHAGLRVDDDRVGHRLRQRAVDRMGNLARDGRILGAGQFVDMVRLDGFRKCAAAFDGKGHIAIERLVDIAGDMPPLAAVQGFVEKPGHFAYFALGSDGGVQALVELLVHEPVGNVHRAALPDGMRFTAVYRYRAIAVHVQRVGAMYGDVAIACAARTDDGGIVRADKGSARAVGGVQLVAYDL